MEYLASHFSMFCSWLLTFGIYHLQTVFQYCPYVNVVMFKFIHVMVATDGIQNNMYHGIHNKFVSRKKTWYPEKKLELSRI